MRVFWLGAGLAVQLVYGLALLLVGFNQPASNALDNAFRGVLVVAAITWIAYFVDVGRNGTLTKETKTLWMAVLLFGTFFGELAYFVVHVAKRPTAEPKTL